jgi:hypothetical protein
MIQVSLSPNISAMIPYITMRRDIWFGERPSAPGFNRY